MLKKGDCGTVLLNIQKELECYIIKNNINSLVLGLSGGIDSALCAAISYPVVKKLNIPFIGRSITIETNTQSEIDRGEAIGKAFCTDFKPINLTDLYFSTLYSIEEDESLNNIEYKIRIGNIKARLRMIYLYNLAQKYKGMVLSTDNYTEYLLGFWTLHGDVGDYGMIQNLWKTEVYELSNYIITDVLKDEFQKNALQLCVDAIPTDGLGITSSDLEQLKANSYNEVDNILIDYINQTRRDLDNPIIKRHLNSEYKRNNPFNILRETIFNEIKS